MRTGDAKETYAADEAMWRTGTQRAWFLAFLAALALLPAVAGDYWLYLACLIGINAISTTGLNILTGFTGQISLGQAAFMGVGGYTAAVLGTRYGVPAYAGLPAAGLLAALVGVAVGAPSLRVKGLYLAVATLAAGVILHHVFLHWDGMTGGVRGLTLGPARLAGVELDTVGRMYAVIAPFVVVLTLMAANLFRTRIGRAFIAIRDRDISAEVLGIDLFRYKLLSFAISAFYAGIAGALWAYFFGVVTPESFPVRMSIFYLAAIIVGGMGSILGSLLGAGFMTLVPEALKWAVGLATPYYPGAVVILSPVREVVFGALIIGFLAFEPHGLADVWGRVRRFFHLWPFRS